MEQNEHTELEFHKKMAKDCFNMTWEYMDQQDKSAEDIRMMIHTAHTSVFHWHLVGETIHQARGEWQVSRVYSLAMMGESALYHGSQSLRICLENGIRDFDLAFAYEAVARALKLIGDQAGAMEHIELAKQAAEGIEQDEDKAYFLSELRSI